MDKRVIPAPLYRLGRRAKLEFFSPPSPPYRHYAAHLYPRWNEILDRDRRKWNRALARARRGPAILIPTSFGGHAPSATLESTLAVALTLRGARVEFLLCDWVLDGCQQALVTDFPAPDEFLTQGPARICDWCFDPAYEIYASTGLTVHRFSDFLSSDALERANAVSAALSLQELATCTQDGIDVGEHALAGALRFYARGVLESTPDAEQVLRRYVRASLKTVAVMEALLARQPFHATCLNHGIYVPQGLIAQVARKHGVRVVTWNPAYRKQRFLFAHHETYHHALMNEPTTNWENIRWSDELSARSTAYLSSRAEGTRDWIWFHENPEHGLEKIAVELGIDFRKPTIGMLTNVMWDAQLHYPANAFANMLEWTFATIRYFATRPDLQLLIRIHPAEIRGTVPSRQPLLQEIQNAFSQLPTNVYIIPPDSNISTYAVMYQCDSVIIYGTKTGVELTSMGIPVIVAGEAWVRDKGVTLDACSREAYFEILAQLPLGQRLDETLRARALKYAFHFFFRRMIPLRMFQPQQGFPFYRLGITRIDELARGADRGLDVVCDGILRGTEFIYPAEKYAQETD